MKTDFNLYREVDLPFNSAFPKGASGPSEDGRSGGAASEHDPEASIANEGASSLPLALGFGRSVPRPPPSWGLGGSVLGAWPSALCFSPRESLAGPLLGRSSQRETALRLLLPPRALRAFGGGGVGSHVHPRPRPGCGDALCLATARLSSLSGPVSELG